MTTQQTIMRLQGKLPFAIQCKIYNNQPLSEDEKARYGNTIKAIEAAEERQYQEMRETFAKHCKMEATK